MAICPHPAMDILTHRPPRVGAVLQDWVHTPRRWAHCEPLALSVVKELLSSASSLHWSNCLGNPLSHVPPFSTTSPPLLAAASGSLCARCESSLPSQRTWQSREIE